MTNGERDERERQRPKRWRGPAGFAVLLVTASVLPIPSGAFGGGTGGVGGGTGGVGGGLTIPVAIGLTDPFHVVGYAVLAGLVTRVTGCTRRGLLLAVAAAVLLGFGIELVQAPIPWRTFAWRDVGVNAVGASLGAAVAAVYSSRSQSTPPVR